MVDDLGIRDHVIFTGFIEDIGRVYSFTDVAVLSSWSEGLPQSMLQALAASVPVVATRVGGVPEVITHEKTGYLVEAGDHESFARQIIRALREPGKAREMARAGRDVVKEKHSVTHMLDSLEEVYTARMRKH
jgi:glycosyltransferase involved in cell wall biosynthesis